MPETTVRKTASRLLSFLRNKISVGEQTLKDGVPAWLVFLATTVILFNYFEIYHNYWFLNLLDGYVIKLWLPPLTLLIIVIAVKRHHGNLLFSLKENWMLNLFLALYICFGLLSLIRNEQLYFIGKYGLIMFGPIALYAAIVMLFRDNEQIVNVLAVLFAVAVLLSLYVLYLYDYVGVTSWQDRPYVMQYMLNNNVLNTKLSLNSISAGDFSAHTKTLAFVDEPAFAAMLAPLILFGLYQAVGSGKILLYLYYLPSFFLLHILLSTSSRSSFIAFTAGLIVFLWFIRKKVFHVIIILIVFTVMLTSSEFLKYRLWQIGGIITSKISDVIVSPKDAPSPGTAPPPASIINRIEEILMNQVTTLDEGIKKKVIVNPEGHVESINKTMSYVKAKPFLGSGITHILERSRSDEMRWGTEHNRYLYILSTSGLLTLAPYVLFISALIFLSLRSRRKLARSQGAMFDIGLVLIPAVLLFAIQINNAGQERYYYWIFFGLAAAWIRNISHGKANENTAR